MESKTPNLPNLTDSRGVTLVELLTTMTFVLILITVITILVNPSEKKAQARDQKRLSDISKLDRIINEYLVDNGYYPDEENVTRVSNQLPLGNGGPFENSTTGWVKGNFSRYTTLFPIDPTNEDIYVYKFRHTQSSYELNAVLETFDDGLNSKDGGNSDTTYEVGNDLSLL